MINKKTAHTPIYDKIAGEYNYTRQADTYIIERLLNLLSANLSKSYLDIGCGTGNYTIKLSENGLSLLGIDPSSKMLEQASLKSNEVKWLQGSAEKIPTGDQTFDAAIAILTVHHWDNIEKSFNELYRVLKKGSKLVFFTSTPEQMEGYWLNHYFPKMLCASIDKMPSLRKLEDAAIKTGFHLVGSEKYFIEGNLDDLFLYSGKHRPEIYFDSRVRSGISSFAILANEAEITFGLEQLQKDLSIGEFLSIKKKYENSLGDYLFIVFSK